MNFNLLFFFVCFCCWNSDHKSAIVLDWYPYYKENILFHFGSA